MAQTVFDTHRTKPEFSGWIEGVWVEIAKVGGGTLGRAYAGRWLYRLSPRSGEWHQGADFETGTPKTHVHAATLLVEHFDAANKYRED